MTEQPVHDLSPSAGPQSTGIPDLKWVNRHLSIRDVCVALGLRLGQGNMVHCWHPERHKAGDRTASVGIRKSTNRVHCFGCGSKTFSVIDVVMDVRATDAAGAVLWLRGHFELKYIPKGQHLKDRHAIRPYWVGHESPIELLVKSGLWANLTPPTQRIVPVLLYFAVPAKERDTFEVRISYRAIQRYSGVSSFGTISKALQELSELEWLKKLPQAKPNASVLRDVNTYILTPYSNALMEAANTMSMTIRATIEQQRELRERQRNARRANHASESSAASASTEKNASALLKSTPLYSQCSVGQNGATRSVAENVKRPGFFRISPPDIVRRGRRLGGDLGSHGPRQSRLVVAE